MLVRLLLEYGADINVLDSANETPLAKARRQAKQYPQDKNIAELQEIIGLLEAKEREKRQCVVL